MKVAVVILNWNGSALLREFLPSVVAHSPGADVYVADNASTDDSVAVLEREFPSVKMIRNDRNYGFASGYNHALKHVQAEVFALVNSDVEVTPGWLEPMVTELEKYPDVAIVQPKILDHKNKSHFEYAGAAGGFIDKFGYPFCRGRLFETLERDNGQYDDADIFWASGACMLVRADVYRDLGGFDTDFFAHQEEIDLCWRAHNGNHRVRYVSASTVFHVGGATLEQGHPRKTFLNFRNSLVMLLKNLPSGQVLPVIFTRLCLDGVAGVQFALRGKFTHTMAILNAHFSFYGQWSKTWRKRTGAHNRKYYKVKSIVYKYFAEGKRTFTALF